VAAIRQYPAYTEHLPIGVRQALKLPLIWVQISNRYPWKVVWARRTPAGDIRKGEQMCSSLGQAIIVWQRARRLVPNATIVSRVRAYDIPPSLRGKLPPRWYWCPRCMKPRRYLRTQQQFVAQKKVWRESKARWEETQRKVWLLTCPMCGCTNRDPVFRRSNQPWEVRRFKRGAIRASPTRRRKR